MAQITVVWALTDEELALLNGLVVVSNADAQEQFLSRQALALANKEPFTEQAPVKETVVQYAARLGLKTLQGAIVQQREALTSRNVQTVLKTYNNPALSADARTVALNALGLQLDGLRIVSKD